MSSRALVLLVTFVELVFYLTSVLSRQSVILQYKQPHSVEHPSSSTPHTANEHLHTWPIPSCETVNTSFYLGCSLLKVELQSYLTTAKPLQPSRKSHPT